MTDQEWAAIWRATGERLRLAREALGITIEEAAASCGALPSTFVRYEAGGRQRGHKLCDFARKYNVSLDYLFCGDTRRLGEHLVRASKGKVAILKVR
jgi:transcriptional regulator with XRE-family HTH domain